MCDVNFLSLLANLTFHALQCPIFNQMSTHGSKTSQITPNWNQTSLTRCKKFQKILIWSFCMTWFTVVAWPFWHFLLYNVNFQSDEYPWKPNFSNHPKLKQKPLSRSKYLSENISLHFLCDVIFLSLPGQSDIPCFTMSNFQSDEYPWKPNFSNHTNLKQKTSNCIQRSFRKF